MIELWYPDSNIMRRIRSSSLSLTQLDIVHYCDKYKCKRTEKIRNNNSNSNNNSNDSSSADSNCLNKHYSANNSSAISLFWLLCILVIISSCQWFNLVNGQNKNADEWAKELLSGEQEKAYTEGDPLKDEKTFGHGNQDFSGSLRDIIKKSGKSIDDINSTEEGKKLLLNSADQAVADGNSACLCSEHFYRGDCPPMPECNATKYEGDVVDDKGRPKTLSLSSRTKSVKESSLMDSKIITNDESNEIKPTVVTHRKIELPAGFNYLNPKFDGDIHKSNNYIGQINLKIPVVLPSVESTPTGARQTYGSLNSMSADNPNPVFKYRKYVQIGSKPQIEMVPITTTIISPRLVSR